ncbi:MULTISPECIES: efflux RND transporter permease subunit [unclassified Marinobacter]|nr:MULTISPECIES: efflux RND transporter permease subunit [unclassified Marinobacter]MAC24210.1 acriflavin resistance protein [Marinobacter sp.]MEC9384910.1 efflux RND transporter permease subunit [Pseudomonadota bacterium]HCL37619.1 AcrB/AcrD/AcrF family protein [Marinobacter nauticus]HCR46736.1 AcrB/AcrD/AcrF family protein [Marinobacter nauticus]|tara:strand:+ start:4322 stop:7348 length:3027 start_codon:yes stop_codon:yes gene_type:complete
MTRRLLNCQRLLGMVVTMLCLLGIAAYSTMPRQEDPSFPYRAGMITVSYPGASAEAVERLVLQPLTDELRQVEELDWSQGTARTGVALARLKLRDRIYDTDSAWDRVRQAMERARQDFPDDVGLMELDDRLIDIPAVVLAVGGSPSVTELSEVAERLKQNLLDIPGISRIELEGDADEQITLALDDAALYRLGVPPKRILDTLARRNQTIPGGFVVVEGKRLSVLPNTEFTDIDAIRATPIELPDGSQVPLAAAAEVWRGPAEPRQPETWFDGERVVLLSIIMEEGSTDAIRFGERIRERLDQVRPDFEPYQLREMFFQPDKVSDRLDDLAWSLVLSVLIIVAVVFTGMGIRMGLLVASILPMVALISVGLYDLGGGVLHQIAVIGMVISLGILIDNAIVIVENIQGHLDEGMRRLDALRKAVGELAGPLGASTGTTLAAFAPLLMARGGAADFTRGVPVMIMLTLSVSYLLAISAVPLLAARFLKPRKNIHKDRLIGLASYLGGLVYRHPGRLITAGALLVVISLGMTPFMAQQFFPNADRPRVIVEMYMPEGTDQARTSEVAAVLEQAIRTRPEALEVHRFVGFTGPSFYYNLQRSPQAPNRARLVVRTPTLADTTDLVKWIRHEAARSLPELDITAGILGQGPPRPAPVEVRVFHPDDNARARATEQVYSILRGVEGTVDVRHDLDIGVPSIAINVDDATAARYGLTRADVAQSLYGQSYGAVAERYRQEDDPIPIVLRSREGTSLSLSRLLSVNTYNDQGDAIPLSAVATVETTWEPAAVYLRNGVRVNTISANLEEDYSFSQALDGLYAGLEQNPLPAGTRLDMGGDAEGSDRANSALLTAAPIGMLLLLFFLLLQFNSFRRVGIILLTVPLATVGIFPGLVLSGSPFGFQSLLGVIALVGIVVNNAIVLLDVMDRELERGRAIADAVRTAVERRTRPILLTTATTVAGLLPLAFSSSTLWPPMAWAIISGLLASTVLTLLVIPSVCTKLIKLPVGEPENAPA